MKPVTRAEFNRFTFSFFLSLEYPVDTLVNALFSTAFWSSPWKISSCCGFLQPKNSRMSPHCLWPVIADFGGHLLFISNILCCQNARKGAIPVPFPTRITGTEPSDGRWKAWALNKTKRERLSHKALENSQRSYGFMKITKNANSLNIKTYCLM